MYCSYYYITHCITKRRYLEIQDDDIFDKKEFGINDIPTNLYYSIMTIR